MRTKSPKKAAEKASKPTVRELAEALGVSIRRVSQLKNEGMPVETVSSAIAWRSAREMAGDSAERLRLERIQLVKEQRRRIELENAVRREELVDRDSVFRSSVSIHTRLRLKLSQAVRNDLPPRLAGLDAPQISTVLREWVDELLENLIEDYRSGRLLPPNDGPTNI